MWYECFYEADSEYKLIIEEETPLKPKKSRFDKITGTTYDAYSIQIISDINISYEEINVEEHPLFSKGRVEIFQNYLKEYSLRDSNLNEMLSEPTLEQDTIKEK